MSETEDDDELAETDEEAEGGDEGDEGDSPARRRARTRDEAKEVASHAMQLMALGYAGKRLDAQLVTKFELSERQARRYRKKIEKELAVSGASPISEMVLQTYQQAIKQGKISAAVGAINALSKLKPADPATLELYRKLGDPPDDPLEAIEYMMRSLVIQGREVMLDSTLEPRVRRAEHRAIARAVLSCVPRQKLKKAHDVVKAFAEGKADPSQTRETENVAHEPGGSLRADGRRGARFRGKPPG